MSKFKVLDDGLIVDKISKSYGNKEVIRDITISIKRGEIVGLLGPNGAGKTTSFYVIVGLVNLIEVQFFLIKKKFLINLCTNEVKWALVIYHKIFNFRGMNVEDNLLSVIEIEKG